MPDDYDDLLSRLNALKGTPSQAGASKQEDLHPSIKPRATQDDIEARFRRLAVGGAAAASSQPSKAPPPQQATPKNKARSPEAQLLEEAQDVIDQERQHEEEDDGEEDLEDLLKELGTEQSSWLDVQVPDDQKVINLLREAKDALRQGDETIEKHKLEEKDTGQEEAEPQEPQGEEEAQAQDEDAQDEKDADECMAQFMADIEQRRKDGTLSEHEDEPEGQGEQTPPRSAREATPFDDLPSAPSTAPTDRVASSDDISSRFASLSTPTSTPGTSSKPKQPVFKSLDTPSYADEDVESWCCICNEDATVRCLGCDGDLYCDECWSEGHRGPDATSEERKHRALAYTRDKKEEKKKEKRRVALGA